MNAHNENNHKPTPAASVSDDARSRQLDDEFADLTDGMLAGHELRPSDELRDLSITARQLQALLREDDQPGAAFRSRLSRRLDLEWNQRRNRRFGPGALLTNNRVRLFGALAAALVLLLAGALILGLGNSSETVTPGLATGNLSPAFILVGGLFVVALIGFGLRRRK